MRYFFQQTSAQANRRIKQTWPSLPKPFMSDVTNEIRFTGLRRTYDRDYTASLNI
jgi:hypothetical protein